MNWALYIYTFCNKRLTLNNIGYVTLPLTMHFYNTDNKCYYIMRIQHLLTANVLWFICAISCLLNQTRSGERSVDVHIICVWFSNSPTRDFSTTYESNTGSVRYSNSIVFNPSNTQATTPPPPKRPSMLFHNGVCLCVIATMHVYVICFVCVGLWVVLFGHVRQRI